MKVCLAACVLLMAVVAEAGEIRGKVVSVNRGEPLRRVQVTVLELKRSANTGDDGTFAIGDIPPSSYTLRVTAVGYRQVTTPFTMASAEDAKEFSITLAPDNFRRTETVDVKGDIFQGESTDSPSHISLTATELKEASTVLANDPFRAVQALPGVSAADNNDFFGQFSVLGAPFGRVAVYVDDVLVPEPFHSIPGFREGASLSVFSSETVQSLDLMPVAFPERYADATGAALAVRTREGSRTRPHFTVSAGMADSDVIAEGGLGHSGKGSWLASARKSYLDYLIHLPSGDPFTNVSLEDADLKLSYDVAPRQNVSFYFLDGHTDVDRHDPLNGLNDLDTGTNDFTLGRVGWRYAVTQKLLLESDAAYIRQRFDFKNLAGQVLNADYYGEWVLSSRTTWSWNKAHILAAGYSARRLRDTAYQFFYADQGAQFFARANGTAFRQSAYVQQASSFLSNRVHIMAGLRWDFLQRIETQPISAQVSIAWQAASATTLDLGYGRYAQFDVDAAVRPCAPSNFPPGIFPTDDMVGRSNHFVAGVEQRFGETLRARLEAYARENREIIGLRVSDANGCGIVRPLHNFPGVNFRDYARGGQITIQRRSANRLSGWLGYTLNYARQRVPTFINGARTAPVTAPTEEDQRHTLNAFATYRLRPTINLSTKFRYGSGTPITSVDFQFVGNTVVGVSPAKERLGLYQRLDFRCDKAWPFARWKMTLYGEVLNLTNHNNPRFITTSFDPITNRATAVTERGLPITPTAGLTFEF